MTLPYSNRRHLSLSTNNIEKLAGLNSLPKLKVLSLGRNQIKKLEALDGVAETLQELWISYNLLEKLVTFSTTLRDSKAPIVKSVRVPCTCQPVMAPSRAPDHSCGVLWYSSVYRP
jgi:hypothetical protein